MARWTLGLVGALVACGSPPPGDTTPTPVPTIEPTADPSYPVSWSRQLPEGFDVKHVHVDEATGDALVVGALRGDVWFSGALISPSDGYEDAVVRFAGSDGVQLWATRAMPITGVGTGKSGRVQWEAQERGSEVRYVGELEGETGAEIWALPHDAMMRGSLRIVPESFARTLRTATKGRKKVIEFLSESGGATELVDRGLVVVGDHSVQVVEPTTALRWDRQDILPLFVQELGQGLVALWEDADGQLLVGMLSASDGTTTWQLAVDGDRVPLSPPSFSLVDGDIVIIVSVGATQLRVHRITSRGVAVSVREVAALGPAPDPPEAASYVVRRRDGRGELVKLGPCPVERCSVEGR
jgi:hypothetical protein